jgi:hypothetical protein
MEITKDIPRDIANEIVEYILEDGACGPVDLVEEKEEGLEEQDSNLSFCDKEYLRQDYKFNGGSKADNVADCVIYFPFEKGYIRAYYAL